MLHYVLLLQDTLNTCQVQSVGNYGGEGQCCYLQLTWPSGWSARNFAALIFRPEL